MASIPAVQPLRPWLFLLVWNCTTSSFLIKPGCIWMPKPQLKVVLCFPRNTGEHRCDRNHQGFEEGGENDSFLTSVYKWQRCCFGTECSEITGAQIRAVGS